MPDDEIRWLLGIGVHSITNNYLRKRRYHTLNETTRTPNGGPVKFGSQRQLFLDDHIIERIEGLKRTPHEPQKRGLVLKPDRPWEKGRAGAFSAPLWDPEERVYKLIYRACYKNWCALAVSTDGIHWEKPLLGMIEFEGSKENSLFSDRRIIKVVHDSHEPDLERRYKGLAINTPVVSADLVHWRDAGGPGVPGGDSGSLIYDDLEQRILAPVKIADSSNETYRQFDLVTSDDFLNWTDARFLFGADDEDQRIAVDRIRRWLSDPGRPRPLYVEPPPHLGWTPPDEIRSLPKRRHSWNAQCNNITVFPYHGQYIALITLLYPTGAYLPGHRNTSAFFMVEVASSRDLKTWNRMREPFLEPARLDHGVVENYERMLVQPVNRPIIKGDELWIYYTGGKEHQGFEGSQYGTGRYSAYLDGSPRDAASLSDLEQKDIAAGQSAIYLASLRLDGFVSLDPESTTGRLLTKPLMPEGEQLFLNASCKENGCISVEAISESGDTIAVSHRVTGDGVRLPVRWQQDVKLNSPVSHPVRLKMNLDNASLYAFWVE